mgnify:CR=1 FL=1
MEGLRERAVFETVFIQAEDEQEKFFKINNHINNVPCKCANTLMAMYNTAKVFTVFLRSHL